MFKDIKMQPVQIQKDPLISHKPFITSVREQTKQYGSCLLIEINRNGKKTESEWERNYTYTNTW